MTNGITNHKNINDDDVNDKFVGAFPSNHMNKFIDHASMISPKKRENIYLWLQMLITIARAGLTGGVYLTLSQKQIFSFSNHLLLMA